MSEADAATISTVNTESTGNPLLRRLRYTLAEKPPFCSGTLELPQESFSMHYGKGRDAEQISLSPSAGVDALDRLERACDAATFGRNAEDVLDETYRKAGKMDSTDFLLGLDTERALLVDIVKTGLLAGKRETKNVRAELYKLNVYGKGSFFKAHKDTPRGTNMFGSLVIVFPTAHEGGALVLRDKKEEWTFDAARILQVTPSDPTPLSDPSVPSASEKQAPARIAYVAFFSDVEHEVTSVLSGHRVTITYNLYWADAGPIPHPAGLSTLHPVHANEPEVEHALSALLGDPTMLPEGGTLGFGLRHAYPFPTPWTYDMPNPLNDLKGWLKGGDAALFRACEAVGLKPVLRLVRDVEHHGFKVMMDRMVQLDYVADGVTNLLVEKYDAVPLIEKRFLGEKDDRKRLRDYEYRSRRRFLQHWANTSVDVHWVTPNEAWNGVKSEYAAYGNEPSLGYVYMAPSLLVDVGPADRRADISGIAGVNNPAVGKYNTPEGLAALDEEEQMDRLERLDQKRLHDAAADEYMDDDQDEDEDEDDGTDDNEEKAMSVDAHD